MLIDVMDETAVVSIDRTGAPPLIECILDFSLFVLAKVFDIVSECNIALYCKDYL